MEWTDLDLDQIIDAVNENYDKADQENRAYETVADIADEADLARMKADGESYMDYLAEYMTTGEYKEWLIDAFLDHMGIFHVLITVDGKTYFAENNYITGIGHIIIVVDRDLNKLDGYIMGRLSDYDINYITKIIKNKKYETL